MTSLPEYHLHLRKYNCNIDAHPIPIRLYQLRVPKTGDGGEEEEELQCEEVGPKHIAKDIRLLSARLRRLHIHVPPQSFLRQIIVRPATTNDHVEQVKGLTPPHWTEDEDHEVRAAILRKRIEDTYRKEYTDVLDCEPTWINTSMPHQHVIEIREGMEPYSQKLRRLSPLEMELLNKYIKEMVDGGRIRPSDSPWGG